MSTVTFDTLAYARKLKSAGFTQEQAEIQAEAQKDMLAEILDSSLATKGDINGLKNDITSVKNDITSVKGDLASVKGDLEKRITGDIGRLEKEVKGDINRLEKEILVLKWMTGFMLAGVMSLILKAFFIS
ncbi:MAG: DUF1640 domain-containing protein [Nitrospinae bacterium]|nr:DUF1640 domain-containing protein [Nitrospinota bacterium]